MIVPIYLQERAKIKNLPLLLDRYRRDGGAIVVYERVFSLIMYSRKYPIFEWVSPQTTHQEAGRRHAMWCALLGWWSPFGLFWTPAAIMRNLRGGTDVTQAVTAPVSEQPPTKEQKRLGKLQLVMAVLLLILASFALLMTFGIL
jgi:hypothetical protein